MKEQLYQLFQDSMATTVGFQDLVIRVGMSLVLGLAIFLSYWLSHAGTIYSKKFNINLITLTVLTTTVMAVIVNNIALSLGMVGALSIVRFRTAIKDPRDSTYIFWAIICGMLGSKCLYWITQWRVLLADPKEFFHMIIRTERIPITRQIIAHVCM